MITLTNSLAICLSFCEDRLYLLPEDQHSQVGEALRSWRWTGCTCGTAQGQLVSTALLMPEVERPGTGVRITIRS